MLRPFRKRDREASSSHETGQHRVLDYQRTEAEHEPRVPFWRDREGWKDLIGTFIAELIVGPVLIIAALWIWFRFFRS